MKPVFMMETNEQRPKFDRALILTSLKENHFDQNVKNNHLQRTANEIEAGKLIPDKMVKNIHRNENSHSSATQRTSQTLFPEGAEVK